MTQLLDKLHQHGMQQPLSIQQDLYTSRHGQSKIVEMAELEVIQLNAALAAMKLCSEIASVSKDYNRTYNLGRSDVKREILIAAKQLEENQTK